MTINDNNNYRKIRKYKTAGTGNNYYILKLKTINVYAFSKPMLGVLTVL